MPKDTFFNLPKDKQQKLITAIKNELSRVPFAQFSINQIIKEADIARGSFYQYFTDRFDMLEYIMLQFRQEMQNQLIERLQQNGGDLFDLFDFVFNCCIEMSQKEENGALYRNVMSDIKVNAEFYLKIKDTNRKKHNESNTLLIYINKKLLNIKNDQELHDLFYILKTLSIMAVAEAFMYVEQQEQIKQEYKRRLMLIKSNFER